MTCVVGIETKEKAYIAGDFQGTGENSKSIYSQPKVFKSGDIIFGYSSSFRFGQLMDCFLDSSLDSLESPSDTKDIYKWLVIELVPRIKKILNDNNFEDHPSALIGVRDQIWCLQDDYSILRDRNGYNSIGSGSPYALGSICSFLPYNKDNPEKILRESIKVASKFDPATGNKCKIVNTHVKK